jgi:cell division septation protein DedD
VQEPSGPPLGERISDWVTSITGSRSEPQNGHAAPPKPADGPPTAARKDRPRTPRASAAAGAAGPRRRPDRRPTAASDQRSWVLRAAAVMLLGLLMLALVVIVLSLF